VRHISIQLIFQGNIEGAVKGINGAIGKGTSSDSAIRSPITFKPKYESNFLPMKIFYICMGYASQFFTLISGRFPFSTSHS